jgi:hypothetical protein
MLSEVFDAVQASQFLAPAIRATSMELTLPIEVRLEEVEGELSFVADLPLWRWRTDFDLRPGQLRIGWEEVVK